MRLLLAFLCCIALAPPSFDLWRPSIRCWMAHADVISTDTNCVHLFPADFNKAITSNLDPIELGPKLTSVSPIEFKIPFSQKVKFDASYPRILVSLGYKQNVAAAKQRTGGMLSYSPLAGSTSGVDKFGCPLIFSHVVTSIKKEFFVVAVTRQPAAAFKVGNTESPARCFLRQPWPATLRVCYAAWTPGSLQHTSTQLSTLEGDTPVTDWAPSDSSHKARVKFPKQLVGNDTTVQVTVVSANGSPEPIGTSVSDVSPDGFTVHMSQASANEVQPWGRQNNLRLIWVATARQFAVGISSAEPRDGVFDVFYIVSKDPVDYKRNILVSGIWMSYLDCEKVRQVEKMHFVSSDDEEHTYWLAIPCTRQVLGWEIYFSDAPCFRHATDNGACSDAGSVGPYKLIEGPGVYAVTYKSRRALLVKKANSVCYRNCSNHGVCVSEIGTRGKKEDNCKCFEGYFGCDCSRATLLQSTISYTTGVDAEVTLSAPPHSFEIAEDAWPFRIIPAVSSPHRILRNFVAGTVDGTVTVGKWWPTDLVELEDDSVSMFCTPVINSMSTATTSQPSFALTYTSFYSRSRRGGLTEPGSYRVNAIRIDGMHETNVDEDGFVFENIQIPCLAFVPPFNSEKCNIYNDCSDHGICSQARDNSWYCECNPAWKGPNCTECARGYNGQQCHPSCDGNSDCSGHGKCVGSGQRNSNNSYCECDSPFVPQNGTCKCDQCSGHGTCAASGPNKGKCDCAPGFDGTGTAGPYCGSCLSNHYGRSCKPCSFETNDKLCAGHGKCRDGLDGDGTCECLPGWYGANCTSCSPNFYGPKCYPCNCSRHGICDGGLEGNGKCNCREGWSGDTCSFNRSQVSPTPSPSKKSDGNNSIPFPVWAIVLILVVAVLGIVTAIFSLMKYRGTYQAYHREENAFRGQLMRELYMEPGEAEAFMAQDGGYSSFAQDWIVKFSSLSVGDIIGSGASGQVYKGVYSGEDVAIKRIVVSQWDRSSFMTSFRREAAILSRLHHPNIVRFFGVSIRPEERGSSATFFIITEFCPMSLGTMLETHASRKRRSRGDVLNEGPSGSNGANKASKMDTRMSKSVTNVDTDDFFKSDSRRMMAILEICRGVAFLHKKNVVHRDLKPDNVLIDSHGRAKLCDFGLSRLVTGPDSTQGSVAGARRMLLMTTAVGTPAYMAPELANTESSTASLSSAVDIYAFGVLANAVWSGDEPFLNEPDLPKNPFLLMERVLSGRRPRLGAGMKPNLEVLIQECWHNNPSKRPLAPDVESRLEKLLSPSKFPVNSNESKRNATSMDGVVTSIYSNSEGYRGVELSGAVNRGSSSSSRLLLDTRESY